VLRFLNPPTVAKARKPSTHEAVIDRLAPKMSRAILQASLAAQGRIDMDALAAGIEAGSVGRVLDMLGLETFVADDLTPTMDFLVEANESGRAVGVLPIRKDGAARRQFELPKDFKLSDAQYDVNTKFPRTMMTVADVDTGLLSSPYPGSDWRVKEMAEALKAGAKFPPITLEQQKNGSLKILDGNTRVAAFREAGIGGKIPSIIRLYDEGTDQNLPSGVVVDSKRTASLRGLVSPTPPLELDLKVTNPKAIAAAQRQAGDLLSSVNSETKATVRNLIARAYKDQVSPRDTARLIRDVVGLNDRQSTALYNYRAGLVEDGRSPDQVERMTERYGNRLLRQRADTIAQTEIHRASAEGQHDLWREGVQEGRINPATARRVWIANAGACDWCSAIEELNPEGAPIDGQFETPDGDMISGPEESHVGCRCSTGLETE